MEEKLYRIEQPDISRFFGGAKTENELIFTITFSPALFTALERASYSNYLHWKDLKYKSWIPEEFKNQKEKFWALVKFNRVRLSRQSKIRDCRGKYFYWNKLEYYEELLHSITIDMSKYLFDISSTPSDYEKYQAQGMIEEAIASSQLEGAHTTRKAAKKMLEEKKSQKLLMRE